MKFDELRKKVLDDVQSCVNKTDAARVDELASLIAERKRVFLVASGRSGCILDAMKVRLEHLGIAGARLSMQNITDVKRGDLVLVGSGSGATTVPLEVSEAAAKAGAEMAIITADPSSKIAKLAKLVIHVPSYVQPEEGSPHTLRSLFEECLLVICDCTCRLVQHKLGVTAAQMQSRHSKVE